MLRFTPSPLSSFANELNQQVVQEILEWRWKPSLRRLLSALESHTNRKAFFDTYAEAMVARHLLAQGCDLTFEVRTPAGKHCDFEVRADGQVFYLHVKRLDTNRPPHNARRMMTISSRLRVLERIKRPYIVQVRWNEGLSDEQMQRLVMQASEFITHAHVGDEMKARDHDGREIGGVRIVAPYDGDHVSVTIGLPSEFVDQASRFRRLMHRAYQQFMPKAVNVILICSGHPEDARDFEDALLGSHIERWDAYPPRGKRLAHGRASDGFWHGQRFSESRAAVWCLAEPHRDSIDCRLWLRESPSFQPEMNNLLLRLFGAENR